MVTITVMGRCLMSWAIDMKSFLPHICKSAADESRRRTPLIANLFVRITYFPSHRELSRNNILPIGEFWRHYVQAIEQGNEKDRGGGKGVDELCQIDLEKARVLSGKEKTQTLKMWEIKIITGTRQLSNPKTTQAWDYLSFRRVEWRRLSFSHVRIVFSSIGPPIIAGCRNVKRAIKVSEHLLSNRHFSWGFKCPCKKKEKKNWNRGSSCQYVRTVM